MGRHKKTVSGSLGDNEATIDDGSVAVLEIATGTNTNEILVTEVNKTVVTEIDNTFSSRNIEAKPLKKDDLYLIYIGGDDQYWTRTQIDMAIQRGFHSVVIPEGSPYTSPKTSKCENCG